MDDPTHLTHRFSSTSDEIFENLRIISENLRNGIAPGQLSHQQITALVDGLPRLQEHHLVDAGEQDNFCPICFVPYLTILTEEEMATAMDSPAHPVEALGVTKLAQTWQCGHMFCRRDIARWISDGHASCPMCRRSLLEHPNPDQDVSEDAAAYTAARLQEFQRANEFAMNQTAGLTQFLRFTGIEESMINEMWRGVHLGNGLDNLPPAAEDDRQEYSGMYS